MNVALWPAQPTDAGATGAILAGFQGETHWMPKLYSGAQAIAFCGEMIARGWVTVAVDGGRVVGFIARDGPEICALYVAQGARGRKVGTGLLQGAKAQQGRLRLRVFQANKGAQRFYTRAGFQEVARANGCKNDENLPEISYIWQQENRT